MRRGCTHTQKKKKKRKTERQRNNSKKHQSVRVILKSLDARGRLSRTGGLGRQKEKEKEKEQRVG